MDIGHHSVDDADRIDAAAAAAAAGSPIALSSDAGDETDAGGR